MGYVDRIEARCGGTARGVAVVGWARNNADGAPLLRFIAVGASGVIRGAGQGGLERRDVAEVQNQVKSNWTGFRVLATQTEGSIRVFVLTPGGALTREIEPSFAL